VSHFARPRRRIAALVILLITSRVGVAVAQSDGEISFEIRPGSASATPGGVAGLSVQAPAELATVEGQAFGREIRFSRIGGSWSGLVGVALDTAPGTYTVVIRATTGEGRSDSRELPLIVRAKTYETRRLRVSEAFVNPPASEVERILREAAQLEHVMTHSERGRLWRESFLLPVPGTPTSSFGRLTFLNGKRQGRHLGADFQAASGTPVRAPNAGRVVLAAPLYFSGTTVVIDHGDGLLSLLAHLSSINVTEGALVQRGEVVGLSGATGRVTGPHLHWAVRLENVSVDPDALVHAVDDLDVAIGAQKTK
jgi:murein DD-endopeptidase MepM/ murein hydrolase activator NlpD